uniref:Uncharacterized protein n=1 Tax=Rhodosorus marinus TaxID=101924 RepID=A0A7S0G710_9RHOD
MRSMTDVPPKKADEVIVDCAIALFEENVLERIFTEQSLFESDEIQQIFSLVGRSPSLRIDETNMAKIFQVMCMVTKANILYLRKPLDMFKFFDKHMSELSAVLEKTSLGEEVRDTLMDMRKQFRRWYLDITIGEFQRIRMTILTRMYLMHSPVSVLLDSKIQHESGCLHAPTSGESIELLGEAKVYSRDNKTILTGYSVSVAGRNIVDKEFPVGTNLFLSDSEKASTVVPVLRRIANSLQSKVSRRSAPDEGAWKDRSTNPPSDPVRADSEGTRLETDSRSRNRGEQEEHDDPELQELLESFGT